LGGRSAHFGPGGLTDSDGKYTAWFERLNVSVVVIRPDFQVFGGVLDPDDTDVLVDDLVTRILADNPDQNAMSHPPETAGVAD
jgi:hypothetical protein